MGDPGGVRLRAEAHNSMINLGVLNQAKAILLQRLILLVELGHVEGELIVICLNLLSFYE